MDALELLRCPRCRGLLVDAEGSGLACKDCGRRFPRVAGIPLLVGDPHEERRQWAYQLHEFAREVDRSRDRLLAQLAGEEIPAGARDRMRRLHAGLADHKARIVATYAEAGIEPADRQAQDRERVPGEGTVTAYYDQMFRDWVWGADEVRAAVAEIEALWPASQSLGRCLVLGAGAGRLPWKLARRFGADAMIALDLNPLPYLVLRRLQLGETVALAEIPQQPRWSADVLVEREVAAEAPPVELTLVFGDGLAPPVVAGGFDTVITPWFIDQVPPDAAPLMRTLASVLRVGGRWLNHGPLIHHPNHTRYAHRYRADEILAMLPQAGLRVDASSYVALPYMHSPASSQGRSEHVLTFVATHTGERQAAAGPGETPAWLDDPTRPVPRLPGLDGYVPPHPMFAAVVAAIDGIRSIRDIADLLVARHGLPPEAAQVGVRGCLQEIVRSVS